MMGWGEVFLDIVLVLFVPPAIGGLLAVFSQPATDGVELDGE